MITDSREKKNKIHHHHNIITERRKLVSNHVIQTEIYKTAGLCGIGNRNDTEQSAILFHHISISNLCYLPPLLFKEYTNSFKGNNSQSVVLL